MDDLVILCGMQCDPSKTVLFHRHVATHMIVVFHPFELCLYSLRLKAVNAAAS